MLHVTIVSRVRFAVTALLADIPHRVVTGLGCTFESRQRGLVVKPFISHHCCSTLGANGS